MAYTDFFIATEEELFEVFFGWKRAAPLLEEFVTKTGQNPFTGEPVTIQTLISDDQPEADPDAAVVVDIRHLPTLEMKNLMTGELQMLACILLGWDEDRASSEIEGRAMWGPGDAELSLWELPPALVKRLAELSPAECVQHGRAWVERLSEDAAPTRDERARQKQMAQLESDLISVLSRLSKLAHRAATEIRLMFLLMS